MKRADLCIHTTRFLHWPSPQNLRISDGITGDNGTVVRWIDVNHNNTGQANHDSLIKRLMTCLPYPL